MDEESTSGEGVSLLVLSKMMQPFHWKHEMHVYHNICWVSFWLVWLWFDQTSRWMLSIVCKTRDYNLAFKKTRTMCVNKCMSNSAETRQREERCNDLCGLKQILNYKALYLLNKTKTNCRGRKNAWTAFTIWDELKLSG